MKVWDKEPFQFLMYRQIGPLTDKKVLGALEAVEGVCSTCLQAFRIAVVQGLEAEKKFVDDQIFLSSGSQGFWSPTGIYLSAVERAGFNAELFRSTGCLVRVDIPNLRSFRRS